MNTLPPPVFQIVRVGRITHRLLDELLALGMKRLETCMAMLCLVLQAAGGLNWRDFEREMREKGVNVGMPGVDLTTVSNVEAVPVATTGAVATSTAVPAVSATVPTPMVPEVNLTGYSDLFDIQEAASEARLMGLYKSLDSPEVERCKDITRLLPACTDW